MAIMADGQSSRGGAGRWDVVLDAGTGVWAIFDSTPPQSVVAHGSDRSDLENLRDAITSSIEGMA